MINWFSKNNDNDVEESEDLSKPEFWQKLGINPIVVDQDDPEYIEKMGNEVCKIIEQVVKELKND